MNLPNINPINIRLRRFFEPEFSACTQREIDDKCGNKQQHEKHGNRNQYFYPEFHTRKNEGK